MSTDTESVVRSLLDEAWNGGDLDLIDQLVDAEYRSHIDETRPVRTSRDVGPMVVREEIVAYRSGMQRVTERPMQANWTMANVRVSDIDPAKCFPVLIERT